MKTKSGLSLALSVLIPLTVLPFSAVTAQETDRILEFELEAGSGTFVTVNIPAEYHELINGRALLDLAIEGNLRGGELITVYYVEEAEKPDSLISTAGLYKYETILTEAGAEWAAQNYFSFSFARGSSAAVPSEFSRALSLGMTEGEPFKTTPELDYSLVASYSAVDRLSGPPENSSYNSREYRVQFYAQTYYWHQNKYLIGSYVGQRSGSCDRPAKWIAYSIDSYIG